MVRIVTFICMLAMTATASADEAVLAKIRVDRFEGWVPRTCYPEPDPGVECLVVDGVGLNKYRITLSHVYTGAVPWKSFVAVLPVTVQDPASGSFLYVIFNPQKTHPAAGPGLGYQFKFDQDYIVVQDWSDAAYGFCLSPDESNAGIAAAFDALRRDHPCEKN